MNAVEESKSELEAYSKVGKEMGKIEEREYSLPVDIEIVNDELADEENLTKD